MLSWYTRKRRYQFPRGAIFERAIHERRDLPICALTFFEDELVMAFIAVSLCGAGAPERLSVVSADDSIWRLLLYGQPSRP